MIFMTMLCLFTYLGDTPAQTSILDYGREGIKLPTFIGSGPNPEFFDQELDYLHYAETDFHLTFQLQNLREKAQPKRGSAIENLRIYNPNNHNIDVVIAASNAGQFKNFLVRVESHFVVDLNIETLAGYDILDLVCMMPFEAELQYFKAQDGTKLKGTSLKAEKPQGSYTGEGVHHRPLASKNEDKGTCPPPPGPLNLTSQQLNCSPDPSVDGCITNMQPAWDYDFDCCPAYQFCTTNPIERWVQINDGNTVARVVRRFERFGDVTGTEFIECNETTTIPTWNKYIYELDLYWPLNGGTPTLTGQGGGNAASNFLYPCLQKTYVVRDSQGKLFNVRGENGNENADDVLLGEAWGYNPSGQIICTVANNCSALGRDYVAWTYKTIAQARIDDQQIHWGNVNVGESATKNLTLTTYHRPYSGTISLSGDNDFSFATGQSISINMPPNQTLNIPITFSPASSGFKAAFVTIPNVGEAYFDGTGYVINPPDPAPFASWPSGHNFGFQALNDSENYAFQVTNNGSQTLTANVTLTGSNMFSLLQGEGNYSFSPNQTRTFTVNYTPTAQGSYQGSLNFDVDGFSPFQINVSGNTSGDGPPEFTVLNVNLSNGFIAAGETVDVTYSIANNGEQPARYWRDQILLSTNGSLVGATQLWESTSHNFDFNPGAIMSQTVTVTIPAGTQNGNYQIVVFADARDDFAEINENDNTGSAALTVDSNGNYDKDLVIDGNISATVVSGTYKTVYLTYTLRNQGTDATVETTQEAIYLSTTPTYNPSYVHHTVTNGPHVTSLAPGASQTYTKVFTLPSSVNTGTYHLIIHADAGDDCSESDETNNMTAKTVFVY